MIIDGTDRIPVINYSGNINLTNACNIEYNWNEHELILHKSVITGKETLVSKGTRAVASLDVIDLTYAQYATLKATLGKSVTFYPYGTENLMVGETAYLAPSITMLVKTLKPYHLNNINYCDAVHIIMESQSYYELALELVGGT